jgi:hypothetical protein
LIKSKSNFYLKVDKERPSPAKLSYAQMVQKGRENEENTADGKADDLSDNSGIDFHFADETDDLDPSRSFLSRRLSLLSIRFSFAALRPLPCRCSLGSNSLRSFEDNEPVDF